MRKLFWLGAAALLLVFSSQVNAGTLLPNVDTQPFVVNKGGDQSGVINWGGVQVGQDPWSQQNSGSVGHSGQQGYGAQGYGAQGYGDSNQGYGSGNSTINQGEPIVLNDGSGAIINWMGGDNQNQGHQAANSDGVIDWLGGGGNQASPQYPQQQGQPGGVIDWLGGGQ